MFSFVHSTGDGGQDKATQRKIRAHAMRDYRRRQRAEAAANDKDSTDSTTAATAKDATAAWREHRQRLASQRRARKSRGSDSPPNNSSPLSSNSPSRRSSESDDTRITPLSKAMGRLDLSHHMGSQTTMTRMDASTRDELVPAYIAAMYPSSTRHLPGLWLRTKWWLSPQSPGMQAAADAVGLAQLGASSQSGRVLLDARKRNVQCIEYLRRELPDPEVSFFGKQAAAHCLLLCEAYSLIGGADQIWRRHVPGVVGIVAARGSKVLEAEAAADPMAFVLFSALRLIGLGAALVQRKAYIFGREKWRRVHLELEANELREIMAIVTILPAMLQRTDEHKADKQRGEPAINELIEELEKLEHEIVAWMIQSFPGTIQFKQISTTLGPDSRPVSADKHPKRNPALDGQSDETYPSYVTMNYRQLAWTCILLTRRALLDLSRLLPTHNKCKESAMKASVEDSIEFLCQCVPFYLDSDAAFAKAAALSGLLFFARSWFEEIDDSSRIAWAEEIQETALRQAPYLVWTNLLPWMFWGLMWFP